MAKNLPAMWESPGLVLKNLPANAGDIGDVGLILGWGRSPGGGRGNPLQCSSLENPHGQRSLAGCSPRDRRVGHNFVTKPPSVINVGNKPQSY